MKKLLWIHALFLCAVVNAERFEIDAVDQDMKTILRQVAKSQGLGIIMPSELGGSVTISVEADRWESIVEAIIAPRGYTYTLVRGVLVIEKEPLVQVSIPSDFITGPELTQGIAGHLGENGTITTHQNGVVVRDTKSSIDAIQRAAQTLTELPPSVFVECRFYETTTARGESRGIDWASLSGVELTSSTIRADTDGNISTGVVQLSSITAVLRALETHGDTKTLAEPSVTVLSGRSARILLGEQYPLPEYSFSSEQAIVQVSGFSYRDIGLSLEVSPRVKGDRVSLRLSPSVSTIGGTVTFEGIGGAVIPTINTREVTTEVSLKDGESLIIGGLTLNDARTEGRDVPAVSKIPLFGNLFKVRQNSQRDQVLTVVVTVRIQHNTD